MNALAAIQFTFDGPRAWAVLWLLVLLPLAGAALAALAPAGRWRTHRDAALGFALATLLVAALAAWAHFVAPAALARPTPLADLAFFGLDSSAALGADGISIWLVLLTAVLTPLAILASSRAIRQRTRGYYALLMLLESAMLGVFLARDLLWFYIFYEFTLVPLFFIIALWGGPLRRQAAFKFVIFTLAGSMLTLAGLLYLGLGGGFGFERAGAWAASLPRAVQVLVFLGLAAGFAVKMPLFPVHTWLPLAHTEAPTAGSVILAGVLLKLGAYGFLRIGIGFLPQAAVALAPFLGALAVAGILYGALGAWVQTDVKKLVAYSSISHLGFCMLGMFALRPEGLVGSVLVMVNHGLSTGALFLVVGMIHERYHTRMMGQIGGLGRRMPVISFFLVVFALSSLGLPGTNGFVSEFLVLLGTFVSGSRAVLDPGGVGAVVLPSTLGMAFATIAAVGVVLSAVYLLHMVRRMVFGPLIEPPATPAGPQTHQAEDPPPDAIEKPPPDADKRECLILAPLALLVVMLGVWPQPLTRSMRGPTGEILRRIGVPQQPATMAEQPEAAETRPRSDLAE